MKTIAIVFTVLVIGNAYASNNQLLDDTPLNTTSSSLYKKMLHFNPLTLIVGGMELAYESVTKPKESFVINGAYYLSQRAGMLDLKDDYSNMNGFKIEMQYRYYKVNNNYINNLFIAPFFNLKSESADYKESIYNNNSTVIIQKTTTQSATAIGAGFLLGSRKSIFENFYMDASIGGGIFLPVDGDNHQELNIPVLSPYEKSVQFKASFGLLIALN